MFVVGLSLATARVTAPDAEESLTMVLEAEELSLTAPIRVVTDTDALGGKYIIAPEGAGGGAAGTSVRLSNPGDYYVWARVKAPSGAAHSFDIEIDGKRYAWLIAEPTDWHWERVTNTDRAGATTPIILSVTAPRVFALKILQREGGASLDQLVITSNAYFVPTDHRHR